MLLLSVARDLSGFACKAEPSSKKIKQMQRVRGPEGAKQVLERREKWPGNPAMANNAIELRPIQTHIPAPIAYSLPEDLARWQFAVS
ncbi:MAG: hypothetical protein KDK23_14020 [Leptospiraceae bacterium]|nr:hypothetical protein [Leptospiraceae bacterium]